MFAIISRRSCRCLTNTKYLIPGAVSCSNKSSNNNSVNNKNNDKSVDEILGSIASKYQVFRNEDSRVILDINEQSLNGEPMELEVEELDYYDEYAGLNTARGITGVYEIDDLVEVLRRENAQNIFVASVPPDLKYVDYICVVSGRSYRHMIAIAQFVRKLFKLKHNSKDVLPKIEGENSKEWIAMDLGNIALHIFSAEARVKYDLDSLWGLGEEYDDESNKPDDPIVQLLQQHSVYLKDLHPADTNN